MHRLICESELGEHPAPNASESVEPELIIELGVHVELQKEPRQPSMDYVWLPTDRARNGTKTFESPIINYANVWDVVADTEVICLRDYGTHAAVRR